MTGTRNSSPSDSRLTAMQLAVLDYMRRTGGVWGNEAFDHFTAKRGFTRRGLSRVLDNLHHRGLVERTQGPPWNQTDRLTAAGLRASEAAHR